MTILKFWVQELAKKFSCPYLIWWLIFLWKYFLSFLKRVRKKAGLIAPLICICSVKQMHIFHDFGVHIMPSILPVEREKKTIVTRAWQDNYRRENGILSHHFMNTIEKIIKENRNRADSVFRKQKEISAAAFALVILEERASSARE